MRAMVQRVKRASVSVADETIAQMEYGLLVFLGITHKDTEEDIFWLAKKISAMRVFPDQGGAMNCSLVDVAGELLVVSQFTLYASTKKGNRPSYVEAAKPDHALPLYERFVEEMNQLIEGSIKTGRFGANMDVQLINDGPVTLFLDSKNKM